MADHSDPVHDDARTLAAIGGLFFACIGLWAVVVAALVAVLWALTALIGAIA